MELNRNPANYFAEVEQAAFIPANIVPGMKADPAYGKGVADALELPLSELE